MSQNKSVAFIGQKAESLPWLLNESDPHCILFKDVLIMEIKKTVADGSTTFITGMDKGLGLIAARIVINSKDFNHELRLECAIPFETQSLYWEEEHREEYRRILSNCDHSNIICPKESNKAYTRRNRYMINKAGTLIAIWDGQQSETGNAVRYAKHRKKRLAIIDPDTLIINYDY